MISDNQPDETDVAKDQTRLMLAYLCIASEKEASIERKVEILDRFGLDTGEIARVCGCADQSIRNARAYLRKHAKGTKKTS
jgi:hypothetical protein